MQQNSRNRWVRVEQTLYWRLCKTGMIPINEIVDFVHTTLGSLTRETFVSRAIAAEFQARGFCVEREACIPVWFESSNGIKHRLGVLQADLIVTDELHPSEQHIIEFKVTVRMKFSWHFLQGTQSSWLYQSPYLSQQNSWMSLVCNLRALWETGSIHLWSTDLQDLWNFLNI